jgi:hypothetical protein
MELRALNTRGVARFTLGDRHGIDDVRESLRIAEEVGSRLDVTRAYLNLASLLSSSGDLATAFEYAQLGAENARRVGQRAPERWFRGETSEWFYDQGDWNGAMQSADQFLAEIEAGSPHYLEAGIRSRRAVMRIARGDIAGALADDARAIELAHEIRDPQLLQPALASSAFIRAEAGDRAAANERLTEFLALLADIVLRAPEPQAAFAAVALGRGDELIDAIGGRTELPWASAAVVFTRGDYAQAADMYAAIGTLPSEAYARLAAGDDANVRRALEFYRAVGAAFYIKRAEAMLPASA